MPSAKCSELRREGNPRGGKNAMDGRGFGGPALGRSQGAGLLFMCSHSCLYRERPCPVPFFPLVPLIPPQFVTKLLFFEEKQIICFFSILFFFSLSLFAEMQKCLMGGRSGSPRSESLLFCGPIPAGVL